MRSALLIASASARLRRQRALEWLEARPRAERLVVIAPTLEAAGDLLREAAPRVRAVFAWDRSTPARFAAQLAAGPLRDRGLVPLSPLAFEAVCARVVFQQAQRGALGKFAAVGAQPGFARALARTLSEVRLAGAHPPPALLPLAEAVEAELAGQKLADRACVLRLALEATGHPLSSAALLLLDLEVGTSLEARLWAGTTGDLLATLPAGDARSEAVLTRALGATAQRLDTEEPGRAAGALARLQRHLFTAQAVRAAPDGGVSIFSAPGESRECAEVARGVLAAARAGVPFDRMAVLLRAPAAYRGLLDETLARAQIPAWFARGALRPDPSGRALSALLACRAEGLSARRFAEYLSLSVVPEPSPGEGSPPPPRPRPERWVRPDDEALPPGSPLGTAEGPVPEVDELPADIEAPVRGGTLRAPRRWERLLAEAAVIGGLDRFRDRLAGFAEGLDRTIAELEPDDPRRDARLRERDDLAALRAFALPLLAELAALPLSASWGEWLDRLGALATRALREPSRVLAVLAELAPMAPVGPVSLAEVRLVLSRRLHDLPVPPPPRRQGQLFVGPIEAARGLSFDTVFVPGLAERLFPQRVIEDPLLRDRERAALPGMPTSADRLEAERLCLRLAVGAAERRVCLSWARIDAQQSRARVPSFYGLEVLRAAEGVLPGYSELMRRAEVFVDARLGWPAPRDPASAVDEAEHDLALLSRTLAEPAGRQRGTGHYLLAVNPHLARALRARARRPLYRWTPADGLCEAPDEARAALAAHAPGARSYSPTALQNFAACPYRFLLSAVHRLGPREDPEKIDAIDPLSRGSLQHEVQFELLRGLQAAGLLPLGPERLPEAQRQLSSVLDQVAARWKDLLAPLTDGLWADGIESIRLDLREWLRRLSEDTEWEPWRFELSFGLPDRDGRDPHSTASPVEVGQPGNPLLLRGSIDRVERRADGALRATDHKSGRQRARDGVRVGGGQVLQPALYALALERLFPGSTVVGGRLSYATYAGNFETVDVPLDPGVRASVAELSHTLAESLATGFFPAAPGPRECDFCDYLVVCGPGAAERARRKPNEPLTALVHLRGLS